ncbi:predicted protein [Naegleria gruberi]|uniref:Predicted protein n=1 Tax=Naegleria gruberi TaxID=5762 RepID=D2VWU2_NAEGR|nr:uncharacterized protein NAEGRDRAFT_81514 [Naegleria gruberi]EFC38683.1 predicted protein [Naegleria gruberi]|eukprot:XP_002671427.1 predicted protein [Naegleria gruberi strain NEG-M]
MIKKYSSNALYFANETFKNDRDAILTAVKENEFVLQYANETLKNDREFILEAVKINGKVLQYAKEIFKSDREIVLEAVKDDGLALEYANEILKHDREIGLEAVKENAEAFLYVNNTLKKDRGLVLKVVKQNGILLQYANELLKKDREIVLEAVKDDGLALEYANETLKQDREISLEASKQEFYRGIILESNIRYTPNLFYAFNNYIEFKNLRNDRKFILEAVKQNGLALEYANEIMKRDREIVLKAIQENGLALEYANETLKKDREIVLKAVKQNGLALEYVNEIMKKDREIVLKSVKKNGKPFQYAKDTLKNDRKFILEAVQHNRDIFLYVNAILKMDRGFILQVIKKNRDVLECADTSSVYYDTTLSYLLCNDTVLVYLLSKHNPELSRKFSPQLTQIIDESNNLNAKLSKDVIELYSKQLNSENDLYYCIELPNVEPDKSLTPHWFSFKPTYSVEFIEKLVIFQILKKVQEMEPSNDIFNGETTNYNFFCFKLDKLLEETLIQPKTVKDLRNTVESISSKFDTSFYSKKEIKCIRYFFITWTESDKSFTDYRRILSRYNEKHGDLSKIFKALNRYYKYFNKNYDFISILGNGAEGAVFKVLHRESRTLMAIKFKYEVEDSEESTNEIINLLKRTDMCGKIKCFDCGMIERHLYSVMELGEESLSDYIQANIEVYRNSSMMTKEKLIEILRIFMQILESVQSIHDHNILHGDLDPQNIVKVGDQYKLIDFETSKVIKTGNSITIARGKFAYMSPEVSHDNYTDDMFKRNNDSKLAHNIGNITISCDIFSLGCILLKLLTHCPLQLDEHFVNDSDLSKYKDNFIYFTTYGKYFYTVVTTSEGETKLHYAIEQLINKSIDTNYGVNNILIRCIITMIQRDSSKRLFCYSYKTTLENVIKFLNGEIEISNIEMDIKQYKEIKSLMSYSRLLEEINKVNQRNDFLNEKIKHLEDENNKLNQEINKLHQRNDILMENNKLNQENTELQEKIKILEEQIRKLHF